MRSGWHHTEETRRKISESRKGIIFSEEHKRRISEAKMGSCVSRETRKKISENNIRYWKGKHLSEETRKKISEAKKGSKHTAETRKKMSEAKKGEKCYMFGKHPSAETLKKMSEATKGQRRSPATEFKKGNISRLGIPNPACAGSNHWNWKGGITQRRGSDWHAQRNRARKRDHHVCVCCGIEGDGRELSVHHLISYVRCYNNCLGNLMTLCQSCHQLVEVRFPIETPKVRM